MFEMKLWVLSKIIQNGKIVPKIKVSSDSGKTINPGYKKVYRIYEKKTNKAIEDIITLENEEIEQIINKEYIYKPLQKQIFSKGKMIYKDMELYEKRDYCNKEMENIPEEVKSFPEYKNYTIKLSEKLSRLKSEMIEKFTINNI